MKIFIYIIKHPQPKRTYPTNLHSTKKFKSAPSPANSPPCLVYKKEPPRSHYGQALHPPACPKTHLNDQNLPKNHPFSLKPSSTTATSHQIPQPTSSEHPKQAQRDKGKPPKKTKLRPLLIFIYIFACLNNKNITPYCIAPYILLLSSREKNSGAYLRPPLKSATTLTAIPSELSRRSGRLPRDPCITRSNPDQPPKPSK